MGILDDAIREHLELKRQHGAADSDVDRLEKEAFGPAARPGDPGYETGESPLPAIGEEGENEAPTTVTPISDAPAPPEEPDAPGAASAEPEASSEPIEAPESEIFDVDGGELDVENMNTEDFAAAASGGSDPSPAERARLEHPHLDDTIDHPGPETTSLSDELEAAAPLTPEETAAAESETTNEPDQPTGDDEVGQAAAAAAPLVDPDPDSDEHDAPQPIEPPRSEDDEDDSSDDDEDDADLLEETPEFLKDAPEGEDLWFEQGPPKDFDFD